MSDPQLADAYRCLRLDEGAGLLDVERAYRALKETYSRGSLATYALLDAGQRMQKLQEIEFAYQQLHAYLSAPAPQQEVGRAAENMQEAPADVALSPGETLRYWREQRGLSLHEVGGRTKISPMTLANIEKQLFERLPAPVYLRGFLVQYIGLLEVPESDALVERYLSIYDENQD